jgi:hypothetical protein
MTHEPFDRVAEIELGDRAFDCVVHLDADGQPYAFHSPLQRGPVSCSLCETPGTRVYVPDSGVAR